MNLITIDFETYFNSKEKYSLKNMSTVEYIHDSRFYVQGLSVKINDSDTQWYSNFSKIRGVYWNTSTVIAHNIKFDAAILAWKYGIRAKQYIDTLGMSKAILGASVSTHSLQNVGESLGLSAKGHLNTDGKKELTEQEEKVLAEYCIRDTDIAYGIYQKLKKDFPEQEYSILDWTIKTFLFPQLKIDGNICKQVYEDSIVKKEKMVYESGHIIGIDISVFRSNPQFAKLLREEGFKVPMKKNKNGKDIPALATADMGFIKLLTGDNARLKELCRVRKVLKQTLEETRANKLERIAKISPYCFDMIYSGATQTHRVSGGSGCAGNPLNFGKKSLLRQAIGV